ncbi:MAG: hypothetical protein LKI39_04755 [Bacteroides sp.]|jgi:hypothetical protein|nr:hypothetical protein [Bacteroides sp.]
MEIRIEIKPYLKAYLDIQYDYCTLNGAIRFIKNQNLYSCLLQLTTTRPKDVFWKNEGNLALILPWPKVGKDSRIYNYMGKEHVELFEKEREREMRMNYYRFILENKFRQGITFQRSTKISMEKYGMEELIKEETLFKSFYL